MNSFKQFQNHPRKMRKFLLLLCALTVLSAFFCLPQATRADGLTAHIIVGGKEAPFVVPPFIGEDGQVYAPVDFVRLLGADYSLNPDQKSLTITAADGHKIDQRFHVAQERFMIPVQSVASQLGAIVHWDEAQRAMTLQARILMVREDKNTLTIVTSYPVYYNVNTLSDPARLFVDIYGATLDAAPATVPERGDNLLRIRSGQPTSDTVRLVLDLRQAIHYEVAASMQTSTIQVALNTTRTSTTYLLPSDSSSRTEKAEQDQASENEEGPAPLPSGTTPQQPAQGDFCITNIEFKNNAGASQVVVTTQGTPPDGPDSYRAFLLDDPVRLAFDLPGASLALTGDLSSNEDAKIPVSSPDITDIRWGIVAAQNGALGRVVLDLAHSVSYNVSTQDTDGGKIYVIDIGQPDTGIVSAPEQASGSLAGKTIVVDPGHGGKDSGALDDPNKAHPIMEKDLALLIGKELRDVLTENGARVVMTRADDTFIPLSVRAQIGIDQHADYFISIHCDSGDRGHNSQAGTTVYYHGNNTVSRDLARSISARLAQLNDGIQCDGIRTDYVRFPGIGFSVLRHSPEPAVLTECGYVNSDHDLSRLEDPDVRHQIALGIVAGLKDYVGYSEAQH